MRNRTALPLTVLALASALVLLASCDSGSSYDQGSYRDRLLGRLPERAMDELREKGAGAIPDLIILTQDPDPQVASTGIKLVGMIKPKESAEPAMPALVEAMAHPEEPVRNMAISELKAMQPVSVSYVLTAMNSGNAYIRRGALTVASKGLGPAAKPGIPQFEKLLQGGSDQEKVLAAMALASIGSPAMRSIPLLQRAAESVKGADQKKMINGCVKRLEKADQPGMYTDSR